MSKKKKKDSTMKMVDFSLKDESEDYLAADAEEGSEEETLQMQEPEVKASKEKAEEFKEDPVVKAEEAEASEDKAEEGERLVMKAKSSTQTGVKLGHMYDEKPHKVHKYIPKRVKY